MAFLSQYEKLRLEVRRRIDAGETSATQLARQTGISQPTISNFLNCKRGMTIYKLDRIMQALHLPYQSLLPPARTPRSPFGEPIPVVRQHIAATVPLITRDLILRTIGIPAESFRKFPSHASHEREAWTRFVAVRVTLAQSHSMHPILSEGAIVILDRHDQQLLPAPHRIEKHPALYAVQVALGLAIGYLELHGKSLLLRPESHRYPLQLLPDRHPAQLITGRICLALNIL